ncbi:MAG: hypothetical protein WCC63_07025 [Candidatus Bathyarchaeia archaeon]
MTSTVTIKRNVEELRQRIKPRDEPDMWLGVSFTSDTTKPHGKYGYCLVRVTTPSHPLPEQRAVSEEEELRLMREHYEAIPKCAKRQHDGYSWATFEDFVKYHLCRCGRFAHVAEAP